MSIPSEASASHSRCVSACDLPLCFNLKEVVAWIAFGDHMHPLQPERTVMWTYHPASAEGRRRWTSWSRDGLQVDRKVRKAVDLLCDAILNQDLPIAGDLFKSGEWFSASQIDSSRRDPIPVDGRPCDVPFERLQNRGGWLQVRDGTEADSARDEWYCYIAIAVADVMRLWPRDAQDSKRALHVDVATSVDGTGAPGRPTKSMPLIKAEFVRRASAGRMQPRLALEARELHEWLLREHPTRPIPTTKTIENGIRDEYWKCQTTRSPDIIEQG